MTDTAILTNVTYLTNGEIVDSDSNKDGYYDKITTSGSEIVVGIAHTEVSHNFDSQLKTIEIPKTTPGEVPETWIIDLNRVKEAVTITGMINSETAVSGDMDTERDNLISLLRTKGTKYIVFDAIKKDEGHYHSKHGYECGVTKCELSKTASEGIHKIAVTINVVLGSER